MNKLLTLIAAFAMTIMCQGLSAQCSINTSNTTVGITPTSLPCIQQGTAYGQTIQVHMPSTYTIQGFGTATIDSVQLVSITNLPSGITYAANPLNAIPGGGNGCVWFSGTTTAPVGPYALTVRIIAYTSFGSIDTTLGGIGYPDTLEVCTAAAVGCDTISNLSSRDTLTYYTFNPQAGSGYISGNNSYGDLEKAEEFSGPVGSQLTGAFLGFGYAAILSADSSTAVTINAYDATGTGGSPGNTIATTTVTLAQIAASITAGTALYVSFATAPTLVAHDFFVSVVLPTTGDTIVLLTNYFYSQDGNGWENVSPAYGGGWYTYQTDYGTFPYVFGNDIAAVTCGGLPLAAFQSSLLNNCFGSPATEQFYNTSSNGVNSISWAFPGGTPATSTAANPNVTYTTNGTYTVQLIAVGSSASDTLISTVNIFPKVTGTVTTTPATGPTTSNGAATVSGTGGTSPFTYLWNDANYDTTYQVSGLAPGTYYVTITDADGCTAVDTAVVSYTNAVISIGANKLVQIYPNPANDVLNINWNIATSADITISDMSGRELAHLSTDNSLSNTYDIHWLAAGTYVISFLDKSTNAEQSVRLIKL